MERHDNNTTPINERSPLPEERIVHLRHKELGAVILGIEQRLHGFGVRKYIHNQRPSADLPVQTQHAIIAHQVWRNSFPRKYREIMDDEHELYIRDLPHTD